MNLYCWLAAIVGLGMLLTSCRNKTASSGVPDAPEGGDDLIVVSSFGDASLRLETLGLSASGSLRRGPELTIPNRGALALTTSPTTGDLYVTRPTSLEDARLVLERYQPLTKAAPVAALPLGTVVPTAAQAHGPRCFLSDKQALYVADFRATPPRLDRLYEVSKDQSDVSLIAVGGRRAIAFDDNLSNLIELEISSRGETAFSTSDSGGLAEGEALRELLLADGEVVAVLRSATRLDTSFSLVHLAHRWGRGLVAEDHVALWGPKSGKAPEDEGEMGGGRFTRIVSAAGWIYTCGTGQNLAAVPVHFEAQTNPKLTSIDGRCLSLMSAGGRVVVLQRSNPKDDSVTVWRAEAGGLQPVTKFALGHAAHEIL